jgi:molybdopterin converting factor small subunit
LTGKDKKTAGKISLRLYSNLARYAGEKTRPFQVPVGSSETIHGLIQRFGIPMSEISMIFVNNSLTRKLDTPVRPGDELKIFGLVGGG